MGVSGPLAPRRDARGAERALSGSAQEEPILSRDLPSGRALVIKSRSGGEEIELRAPDGCVEVRITCGPEGPVVSLAASRLELDSPEVAIRCQTLEVAAARAIALKSEGRLDLQAEGEVRLESEGDDVHMNGQMLRLNCDEGEAEGPQAS